jgi:hypothetical protein
VRAHQNYANALLEQQMQPDSSVRISSAESPPRSLDSPDSCIVEADVSEVANESGLFAGETICIEMESTKIT